MYFLDEFPAIELKKQAEALAKEGKNDGIKA
jgi:hypothetical protein